jgi:hypothetical protein
VIKAEMNAIIVRNLIEQSQVLRNVLFELEIRGREEYRPEVYIDANSSKKVLIGSNRI